MQVAPRGTTTQSVERKPVVQVQLVALAGAAKCGGRAEATPVETAAAAANATARAATALLIIPLPPVNRLRVGRNVSRCAWRFQTSAQRQLQPGAFAALRAAHRVRAGD